MVLLTTAAVFAGLSIALFVVGLVLDRPGIAMFGAVLMIGVGGTGVVQGYQVETGLNVTTETETLVVGSSDVATGTHVTTADLSSRDDSWTGIDLEDDGSEMFLSGDQTDAVHGYAIGTYSLSLTSYEGNSSVANETTTPTGVEMRRDGEYAWVSGSDNNTVYEYNLTDDWNVTSFEYTGVSYNASARVTSLRGMSMGPNGDRMLLLDEAGIRIIAYNLTQPYNVSTAQFDTELAVQNQMSTPTGMDFGDSGNRLLLVGEDTDSAFQYELGEPYDISTASYSGNQLDLSNQMSRPGGIAYEDAGRVALVTDRFDGEVEEYDLSTEERVTQENREIVYRDVDTVSSFPLEVLILLLGALMLMSGAGEASETGRDDPPWRRR